MAFTGPEKTRESIRDSQEEEESLPMVCSLKRNRKLSFFMACWKNNSKTTILINNIEFTDKTLNIGFDKSSYEDYYLNFL